jgi:hypothetical protein
MKNESTLSELRVLQAPRHRISNRPYKHLMEAIQAAKLGNSRRIHPAM